MGHFYESKKCCPRTEDRTFSRTCRLQGQALDLRGQGQGLQNVSSRTPCLVIFMHNQKTYLARHTESKL